MTCERCWSRTTDDAELARLHRKKFTDYAIAEIMEFSVQTIRANMRRLGLNTNRPAERKDTHQEQPVTPTKERPNPLAIAMTYLGRRLVEKPSGYWLDSVPANLDTIMRETNRARVKMGMEQIGPCDRWRV